MTEPELTHWEGEPVGELARAWRAPALHCFASVGSTNDVAKRLAVRGAPSGTVVLADRQLAGRGRAGRAWSSREGLGLWFSLILRPRALASPGAVPLLVGLTVADALDPFVRPSSVALKWPNDLVSAGRKLGGVLCEGAWESERPAYLIVGVGLNVLHAPGDFPDEIRETATSVRLVAGWRPDRREVAAVVVGALQGLIAGPLELSAERLAALERRDVLRGRKVTVTEPATGRLLEEGTALGVAPDGALLLRLPRGAILPVHSGTVRLAE